MPATTVSIVCDVSLPNALEFTSATFRFQLSEPDYDAADNETIATTEVTAVADASGVATVALWPVTRGTRNSFYRVSLSAAVMIGGVPKWQDYSLGVIRPPATGAPHDLADLLAQSSGGIIVGSTVYATLADAVAAAVAAASASDLSADGAAASAIDAASSAADADAARVAAELARDATIAAGDVYPDIATGRAAVANGEQFTVAAPGALEAVRYRRDSPTTQTELARFPLSAITDELRADLDLLDTALIDKGNWNPIGGVFPGSGIARRGWLYRVSGFGATVDGVRFEVGDWIVALIDNASTATYAGNWEKREEFRRENPEFTGTVTMADWEFSADARGLFLNSADDLTFWGVDTNEGNMRVGATVFDMSLPDRFAIGYDDGHIVMSVDYNTGSLWLGTDELPATTFRGLRVEPQDGSNTGIYTFQVDQATGYTEAVFGPTRLSIGLADQDPPGGFQSGAVMDHTRSGEYGQYLVEDGQGTRKFLYRDNLGAYSPHVLDTPRVRILEAGGQSWAFRRSVAADLDYEDPSGETRARVEEYVNREVVVPKPAAPFPGVFPYDPNEFPYITGYSIPKIPIDGLRGIRPAGVGESFTIGDIATFQYAEMLRSWGLSRDAIVSLRTGRSGTHERCFIPEGTSYTWSGGTEVATAIDGEFLWANDIELRAETEAVIRDQFKKRHVYGPMTFLQGLADGTPQDTDSGEMRAYMDLWSAQQNALGLRTARGTLRPLIVGVRAPDTDQPFLSWGPMDQIDWGVANAGGNFYLKGPRYHLPYEDHIHQSAMSALREGEEFGVAMAYLERFGTWEPLRVTSIVATANRFVINTNAPAQASGVLVADTVNIPAAPAWGITVRSNTGTPLTVSARFTGAQQITVDVVENMTAFPFVEFGLGARGTVRPDGTPAAPQFSACVTNIKMVGLEVGQFTRRTVDQPILPHLQIITVL